MVPEHPDAGERITEARSTPVGGGGGTKPLSGEMFIQVAQNHLGCFFF